MGPKCPEILFENVIRRHVRRIEDLADAPKHVASVVKRYQTDRFGNGYSCLQVYDRKSIATERYRKRLERNGLAFAVEERSDRVAYMPGAVSLNEIVDALNLLGVGASDLVVILESLKQAGSLQAEMIVL